MCFPNRAKGSGQAVLSVTSLWDSRPTNQMLVVDADPGSSTSLLHSLLQLSKDQDLL